MHIYKHHTRPYRKGQVAFSSTLPSRHLEVPIALHRGQAFLKSLRLLLAISTRPVIGRGFGVQIRRVREPDIVLWSEQSSISDSACGVCLRDEAVADRIREVVEGEVPA